MSVANQAEAVACGLAIRSSGWRSRWPSLRLTWQSMQTIKAIPARP
jgi:hypothetical protein